MASNIRHCIAVASGKGGVGKSTTAVNLAIATAQTGARVGLLDADIYGPSIPRLMGLEQQKPEVDEGGNTMIPLEKYGVKTMSIGFLVDEGQAMIWRGPMASGALMQLLNDVAWGDLDYLFIDMPPGTGDIHLTLAQKASLSAAVVVTTPQDIALVDCKKGITMFDKVHVPTLGIVENMSVFVCPHCHQSSEIFASGGAERLANESGTKVLSHIPLDIAIRQASDDGKPLLISHPESEQALAYQTLASAVIAEMDKFQRRKIDIPIVGV